jgi:hypothetical protein
MTALLTVIYNLLCAITTRVYLETADKGVIFPYVVFKIPNSSDADGNPNGNREDFILEVDVWDNLGDTTRLEDLTTSIDAALQRTHNYNTSVAVSIYRLSKMMIPDPDKNIRRRQLRYRLATYLFYQ